ADGLHRIALQTEERTAPGRQLDQITHSELRQGAVRLVRRRANPLILWGFATDKGFSFCVALLPFRHSFCKTSGLSFAHEGVGSRAGVVVVAAWRGMRAGGRASLARTRTYPADQLLSGFAPGELGRCLYRPQWRLWPRKQQLVQFIWVER